ncbi:hypothetical protein K438DRAFT_1753734 [Mycena galopus ATCC 62051]|nr:hypothetical protein K438DRAFT_1753734 [Mycena galopus ATCC 62051]
MRCFGLIRVWNDPACTFSFQFGCGIMLDLEPHHKFLSSHMTVTLGPEENIKTKRRCLLPRPAVVITPPLETQRRVRPPPAPPVKPHPEGSQEAAEWRSWATELGDMFLRNDTKEQASVPVDTMDDAAQAETLERDAEKQRLWDIAVALAVEEMRWPERRDWFRCEREQEERQRMQEECDHTPPSEPPDTDALRDTLRRKRLIGFTEEMERARRAPRRPPPSRPTYLWPLSAAAAPKAKSASTKPSLLSCAAKLRVAAPKAKSASTATPKPSLLRGAKLRAATHKAKPALSEIDSRSMEGVRVFHREPDWSEASDDDEYDPASRLPHFPRWNISSRRIDAMFTTPTPETSARPEKERAAAGQMSPLNDSAAPSSASREFS